MDHHHPHDASSTISTSEQQEQGQGEGEEEEANDAVDLDLDNNNHNDDDDTIFMDFSVSPSDEFLLQEQQQQQQQQQEPNHPTMWDWNPSSSSSLSLSFLQRRQYESELSLATYMTDLGGGDGGMMDNNTNNDDNNNHAFHHHPQDNTTATSTATTTTTYNNEDQSIAINNIQRMILPTTVRPIDTATTTRLSNSNTNNDDDDDDGGGGSKKQWHTSSSLLNNVPPSSASSLSITTTPPLLLPPPPFTFITDPTLGILTEANWFNDYEKWNINNNDDDDMKPKKDDTTTTTVTTTTTTAMFMDLPLDLIIHISSYLDFKAIQNCMVTNRTYRNVLIHAQQSIWKPLYYKKWPHLLGTPAAAPATATAGEVPNNNNNNDCEFSDIFSIPITCVGNNNNNNNNNNNKEEDDVDDTKSAIVVDDDSNHFADDIISTTTTTTMINHSLLLSLGAQNTPNCIDLSLLEPGKRAQRRHFRRLQRRFGAAGILFPPPLPLPPLQQPHQDGGIAVVVDDDNNNSNNTVLTNELITVTMFDGTTTGIQFIGTVGDGDRCIRSDQPLPRPLKKLTAASASGHTTATGTTTNNNNNIHNSMQVGIVMLQSLLARLQRDNEALLMDHQDAMNRILHLLSQQHSNTNNNHNANGNSNSNNNNVWRPFVAPFLSSDGTINVTPRLISYYEITIHEKGNIRTTETGTAGNNVMNRRRAAAVAAAAVNNGFRIPTDCVAVGLATSDFQLTDRMPGWDINSIGYHGDDGGLFYGAGMMSRRIGPSFGLNDTVGCGIDYSCHCIFFTLNGTFLGYEPIRSEYLLHRDLYPVIGIDTNYPITANFGLSKPFQFDLTNMIYHQKNIICQALQINKMNTNPAHSSSSTEKDNTETVTSAKYRLRSVSA